MCVWGGWGGFGFELSLGIFFVSLLITPALALPATDLLHVSVPLWRVRLRYHHFQDQQVMLDQVGSVGLQIGSGCACLVAH